MLRNCSESAGPTVQTNCPEIARLLFQNRSEIALKLHLLRYRPDIAGYTALKLLRNCTFCVIALTLLANCSETALCWDSCSIEGRMIAGWLKQL